MRDPVKSAIKADAKTWLLAIPLILLYLVIGGEARGTDADTQSAQETSHNALYAVD